MTEPVSVEQLREHFEAFNKDVYGQFMRLSAEIREVEGYQERAATLTKGSKTLEIQSILEATIKDIEKAMLGLDSLMKKINTYAEENL